MGVIGAEGLVGVGAKERLRLSCENVLRSWRIWTYFSSLCFRQLQDGQVTLLVHAGEKAAPLLLKARQVLQ